MLLFCENEETFVLFGGIVGEGVVLRAVFTELFTDVDDGCCCCPDAAVLFDVEVAAVVVDDAVDGVIGVEGMSSSNTTKFPGFIFVPLTIRSISRPMVNVLHFSALLLFDCCCGGEFLEFFADGGVLLRLF